MNTNEINTEEDLSNLSNLPDFNENNNNDDKTVNSFQITEFYIEIKTEKKLSFEINNINNFTINHKIQEHIKTSNSIIDNYLKENNELKKYNEILEREINLLKSLILINNLNLNTSESMPCIFPFNFSM
jgi:hypothetical protein